MKARSKRCPFARSGRPSISVIDTPYFGPVYLDYRLPRNYIGIRVYGKPTAYFSVTGF